MAGQEKKSFHIYLNDVMNSVVIGVANVNSDGDEGETIAFFASLDDNRTSHHGMPWTADGTIVHDSTAGGTVMKYCREGVEDERAMGGGEERRETDDKMDKGDDKSE